MQKKPLPADAGQSAALLAWYDRHRRVLPWRAAPGQKPDSYRVWLSEIMLQQTTVRAVGPYYVKFLARWPTVQSLAATPLEEVLRTWAGLGYYARARNLHACARAVVERHGGHFPQSETALRALPGIGVYTAAAISAIAYDQRACPVDSNVERVVARLFAIKAPLPGAKPEIRVHAQALTPMQRPGDFAQALMDLGATICTPKRPACVVCPLLDGCAARARGEQEVIPRREPKRQGRLRSGATFVILRAGQAVLLRRRPERGLLGGMSEMPTSPWMAEFDAGRALEEAPLEAHWRRLPGVVTHVFTHFPLELVVYRADVPAATPAPAGARWVPIVDLHREALPTVMRKVLAHALPRAASPRARQPLGR